MDTNIIKLSDILLKASEKPGDRETILDVVVRPSITEVLQKAGLDPQQFSAVDCSIQRFLELPITHKEEDDSFSCVYYDCCTPHALYRVECCLTLEPETVAWDTTLYKLVDYAEGNREWLYFCDGQWEQGPGEDFFDVAEILFKRTN